MSEFAERISQLSPKRLALLALELQSKVESLEKGRQEPIAVIGIGCRFPGGADARTVSGGCLATASTRSPKCRPTAGTSRATTIPIRTRPER